MVLFGLGIYYLAIRNSLLYSIVMTRKALSVPDMAGTLLHPEYTCMLFPRILPGLRAQVYLLLFFQLFFFHVMEETIPAIFSPVIHPANYYIQETCQWKIFLGKTSRGG